MDIRYLTNLKVHALLLVSLILCFFPGVFASGVVTLESIQIFNTHEWFNAEPTVYFHCKREDKTILPDVKKADVVYTYRGEESWQPLTELRNEKCKRCGLYEMHTLTPDDIFDEWEFCSDDFIDPNGKYMRFKDKEFNATFLCPQCVHLKNGSDNASGSHNGAKSQKKMNVLLVVLVSVIVSTVSIIVAAYRYWQQRQREQDQAQFLRLFEDGDGIFFDEKDGDDIEVESGVKQVL